MEVRVKSRIWVEWKVQMLGKEAWNHRECWESRGEGLIREFTWEKPSCFLIDSRISFRDIWIERKVAEKTWERTDTLSAPAAHHTICPLEALQSAQTSHSRLLAYLLETWYCCFSENRFGEEEVKHLKVQKFQRTQFSFLLLWDVMIKKRKWKKF